jgi:tetratricopeptide (TPR) repeat protein
MRFLLLALLLFTRFAFADSSAMDGDAAYSAGKFEEALKSYESAATRAPKANLYFNLGNAAYRAQQPGRAAVAYERALLIKPDHPEALANLKFVRGKSGARVDQRSWVERGLRLALQPFTAWLALTLGWTGFILIGYAMVRRSATLARWLGVFLVVLGFASAIGQRLGRREFRRVAVVTAQATDARTEPADRAALAEALPAGSWVRILSEQGGWTYCELPGGGRGWLDAKSVERLLPDGFL